MSKEKDQTKPFYKKPLAIILIFIFFPPVGIPLFFKYLNKPSKNTKTITSIVWGILWAIIIISSAINSSRTYTIDGKQITITCNSYCSYIDKYGDKDTLKILATMGIERVINAPETIKDGRANINIESSSARAKQLTLEFSNNKVTKIYNKNYPSVIYYSSNSGDEIAKFPADDKISAIIKAEDDKKAAEKAAADAKKAQEEAEQKAIAEKYPSAEGTMELCGNTFSSQYPFNGSKVHSILGVITNTSYETDSRLYKAEVTIANAFGASYDAVMECVVKKVDGTMIQITSFNVYR